MVLKNCDPELSYISAIIFIIYFEKSGFPDCWKVLSVFSELRNVVEMFAAKNYRRASLLDVVGKIFEILVNKRLVGHFQYGFKSFRSPSVN